MLDLLDDTIAPAVFARFVTAGGDRHVDVMPGALPGNGVVSVVIGPGGDFARVSPSWSNLETAALAAGASRSSATCAITRCP